MRKEKQGAINFNVIFSLLVLIPSAALLVQYLDALGKACSTAENAVIFAIISGGAVLLSSMKLLKEILMPE